MSVFNDLNNACAMVRTPNSIGVAYLVAERYAATANSVVRDLNIGDEVELIFNGPKVTATLHARNAEADCAVLKLNGSLAGVNPVNTATTVFPGAPWRAYGFPRSEEQARFSLTGDVRRFPSNSSELGLFSWEVAAGHGPKLHSFEGTPVLVNGFVVGHLTKLFEGDRDASFEVGNLNGCPMGEVRKLLPDMEPPEHLESGVPWRFDLKWYVNRPQLERRALGYLRAGSPVVLFGPSKLGRTTVFNYLLHNVREFEQYHVFNIHLRVIETRLRNAKTADSRETFEREIAREIHYQTGKSDFDGRWDQVRGDFKTFLEKEILLGQTYPAVLSIDEADAISKKPYCEDFFSLLRAFVDMGAGNALWNKFRLVLSISSHPSKLIQDPLKSPFNLVPRISIPDFSAGQVENLAVLYGLKWRADTVKEVMEVIGGNPYLVRLLMYETTINGELPEISEKGVFFEDYLDPYREWLERDPQIREEFLHFRAGDKARRKDGASCDQLAAAGILIEEEANWFRLRYGLYKRLAS